MRWAEVIRVRTQPDREQEVARGLADVMDTLGASAGLSGATLYARSAVPSDLSLHLEWETVSVPDRGSEVALSIARELQPFGLLDHLLLVEKQRYSRPRSGAARGKGFVWRAVRRHTGQRRAGQERRPMNNAGIVPVKKKGETP